MNHDIKTELRLMLAEYRRGVILTVAVCLMVGAFVGAVVF